MGSEKSLAVPALVRFGTAREADRRVAGVAAAARVVRDLAEAGTRETWLIVGDGRPLAAATLADLARLGGPMAVRMAGKADFAGLDGAVVSTPGPMSARDILRRTGKPDDGPVSRWLNRPVSRFLSLLVLRIAGARPIHATAATAVLALAMFAALLAGGELGLVLGGVLFHAASVVDGVDGEMARATFRASAAGATLDSIVDLATNALFILGLTIALGLRDGPFIAWVGGWGLGLFAAGSLLIAWRVRRGGRAPLRFNLLKERYGTRFSTGVAGRLIAAGTVVTSRDFFALLFMTLILVGAEAAPLYIFAAAASIWIPLVLGAVFPRPRADGPARDEMPQCSAGA